MKLRPHNAKIWAIRTVCIKLKININEDIVFKYNIHSYLLNYIYWVFSESSSLKWTLQKRKAFKQTQPLQGHKKIFNTISIHQATIPRQTSQRPGDIEAPTKTSHNYLFYRCKLQVLKIYALRIVANIQSRIFAARKSNRALLTYFCILILWQ